MTEPDERLRRLLSDEESVKRFFELASSVMAGQNGGSSDQTTQKQDPTPRSEPDLASVLGNLTGSSRDESAPDASASASPLTSLLAFMPQLLQALSGNTSALQSDRVALLRALQPYMPQGKNDSIERALRMATLTVVARDILRTFGR